MERRNERCFNLKEGFAIVEYANWNRFLKKTFINCYASSKDEAIYMAKSLSKADRTLYCVYDAATEKIIY